MIGLVLHGGAGARRGTDYSRELADMRRLLQAGHERLCGGACALDVAVEIVTAMEASGIYVAGRGASPNSAGTYELDAAVMDGATSRAGAVAALEGFQSPIAVARAVMERTPHVLIVGDGAARFARAHSFEPILDQATWFTPAARGEANYAVGSGHGTVGCIACDVTGSLASATSTGGVFGKLPGRVGDTPLIGSGCWADGKTAVLATGQGEFFIRSAAAAQVSFRVQYSQVSLGVAVDAVLAEIATRGGEGGLIAMSVDGDIVVSFNAEGMKWGVARADGSIVTNVFDRLDSI